MITPKDDIPIDEAEFWHVVDEVGWSCEDDDYDAKKAALTMYCRSRARELKHVNAFTVADQLRAFLHQKRSELADALEGHHEEKYMGGDSFRDLRNHIVGLGRETYEEILEDPAKGWEIADNYEYRESFAYCFPGERDFEKLRREHYPPRALKLMGELAMFLRIDNWSKYKEDVADPVRDKANELFDLLELFPGWRASARTEDGGRIDSDYILERADEIREVSEDFTEMVSDLGIGTGGVSVASNKWVVWNLVSDFEFGFEECGNAAGEIEKPEWREQTM